MRRTVVGIRATLSRFAPTEQLSTLVHDVRHAWRTWRRTPVLTLAVTGAVMAAVALSACYLPARHAARVDPLVALKSE